MDERQLKTNFLIELNELLVKYGSEIFIYDVPGTDESSIDVCITKAPFGGELDTPAYITLNRGVESMFDINEILDR